VPSNFPRDYDDTRRIASVGSCVCALIWKKDGVTMIDAVKGLTNRNYRARQAR
jgi:hypothetical protein